MDKYLSLFPLDVVLFPEMILPLHIFEERYKEMIGDCLLNKSPFGVLYMHDDSVEEVGCLAEVTKILKKYNDGRMDIVTTGRQRFQVVVFDNEKSFLRGIVEPYFDTQGASSPTDEEAGQLMGVYESVYRLLNKSEFEKIDTSAPYEGLSFRIASVLNLNNGLKQQILAAQSEKKRVSTLLHYLVDLVPRLQQIEESVRRAGSNGNLMKDWK
jgi:Lon protease-like protein